MLRSHTLDSHAYYESSEFGYQTWWSKWGYPVWLSSEGTDILKPGLTLSPGQQSSYRYCYLSNLYVAAALAALPCVAGFLFWTAHTHRRVPLHWLTLFTMTLAVSWIAWLNQTEDWGDGYGWPLQAHFSWSEAGGIAIKIRPILLNLVVAIVQTFATGFLSEMSVARDPRKNPSEFAPKRAAPYPVLLRLLLIGLWLSALALVATGTFIGVSEYLPPSQPLNAVAVWLWRGFALATGLYLAAALVRWWWRARHPKPKPIPEETWADAQPGWDQAPAATLAAPTPAEKTPD